jgi:hypothetical protein
MKKYGLNYPPSYNTLLTSEIGQQLEKEGLNFLAYTEYPLVWTNIPFNNIYPYLGFKTIPQNLFKV